MLHLAFYSICQFFVTQHISVYPPTYNHIISHNLTICNKNVRIRELW